MFSLEISNCMKTKIVSLPARPTIDDAAQMVIDHKVVHYQSRRDRLACGRIRFSAPIVEITDIIIKTASSWVL